MNEILSIWTGGELTAAGLLALVVLCIIFGVLVPWRQVNRIIAERDAWHEAHTVSEAARGKLAEEQYKMLETMRISGQLLATPPATPPTGVIAGPGGSHVGT